jgi:hypothetical protein
VKEHGSIKALASALGLPYGSLHHYVKGDREVSQRFLEALHSRLGVSIAWFLTGEGPMRVINVQLHDQVHVSDDLELEIVPAPGHAWLRFLVEADCNADVTDRDLADLVQTMTRWWAQADPDERTYLRVALRRAVPEIDRKSNQEK